MSGFTKYKLPSRRLGIDDLRSEYAFHGNSQGDESVSNSVDMFISQKGWMSISDWFKDIDYLNQEEVDGRVLEIKQFNADRIEKLKISGDYGKESEEGSVYIEHDHLYDTIRDRISDGAITYRYEILDLSK